MVKVIVKFLNGSECVFYEMGDTIKQLKEKICAVKKWRMNLDFINIIYHNLSLHDNQVISELVIAPQYRGPYPRRNEDNSIKTDYPDPVITLYSTLALGPPHQKCIIRTTLSCEY